MATDWSSPWHHATDVGDQCARIFREADELGGIPARMRLASIARITSSEAAAIKDEPEIVTRLTSAMSQLRSELLRKSTGRFQPVPSAAADAGASAKLRRQIDAMVDLLGQRALLLGDVREAAGRVTEVAAVTLGVARVSVWLLEAERTKLRCVDLFEAGERKHSTGTELTAADYPPYFEALHSETTITANNAKTDPRTSCFTQSYLTPLGIGAMLDVPVIAMDKMVGVICHEHLGGPRSWNADEERFGYLMANLVALALERSRGG